MRNLDEIESPPRHVRWDVRAQILLLPVKWIFLFLLLMAPFGLLGLAEPYRALRLAFSETRTTGASVTNSKRAKSSAYQYTYQVDGKTYSGGGSGYARSGAVVYVVDRPDISRLEGESGFFSWLIVLPLLGIYVAVLSHLRRALQGQSEVLRLLQTGECARAKITMLDVITIGDGGKRYNMEFSYTPAGASEVVTVPIRTGKPNGLGDEHEEDILYDPLDPQKVVFLDALPGKISWGAGSGWISPSPHLTGLSLLFPLGAALALLMSCKLLF